mgnify:CR=1 FL=1
MQIDNLYANIIPNIENYIPLSALQYAIHLQREKYNIKFWAYQYEVINIKEQEKIAEFLDEKCAEIDALYSDIEKQVETLEEYKKKYSGVLIVNKKKGYRRNYD